MNTYYTKLLIVIFLTAKSFIPAFSMQSPIKGKDSFKQIERDLRTVQEGAITGIREAFPLIPKDEWQKTLMNINLALKKTRNLFYTNSAQTYYFQPKLDKKFTNQISSNPLIDANNQFPSSCLFDLKKEFSLNRWALWTQICMTSRNMKSGTVTVENLSDERGALAYAKTGPSMYEWSLFDWCWKLSEISKEQCIAINWPCLKKYFDAYSDKKYAMFQMNTINHELTHLIEAHVSIHSILLYIVKEYYPHTNLDNHQQFINLQKAHELIAETVPRMFSFYSALLEEKRQYKAPSNIHPSSEDLKPWIQRIISCYENYYGKVSHFDKAAFFKSLN